MFTSLDPDRAPLKTAARAIAVRGTGWAATAMALAATMVIAFAAPI